MRASGVQHLAEQALKPTADVASIGIAGGALLGYLPPIAAGLSIIWLSIQIGEKIYFWRNKAQKDKK